jgi:hypothetical protein
MVITVLIVTVFALLAGMRVSMLVGHDGAVHCAPPGVKQASVYRRKLERKFGTHR